SRSDTHDCGGDAAAYVLGALEVSEAEDFRRHLDRCVVCRDEVAAVGQVVDELPMAATQHQLPSGLRRRVMRGVRGERRVVARRPKRWRPQVLSGRFVPRPALAGAVLTAAALAILGGLKLGLGGGAGVRVIHASVTAVPGSAQLRIDGAHAELIVRNLSPPPAGRIYELWIKHGHEAPQPTRVLFTVTAAGAAEVGVPGDLRGANTIMVTQEPRGGSLVPTHAPVIVAQVT
ncbi:MAG TPA: anti-sigma factor, partial [Solirubrobacteraceae bacterium]